MTKKRTEEETKLQIINMLRGRADGTTTDIENRIKTDLIDKKYTVYFTETMKEARRFRERIKEWNSTAVEYLSVMSFASKGTFGSPHSVYVDGVDRLSLESIHKLLILYHTTSYIYLFGAYNVFLEKSSRSISDYVEIQRLRLRNSQLNNELTTQKKLDEELRNTNRKLNTLVTSTSDKYHHLLDRMTQTIKRRD